MESEKVKEIKEALKYLIDKGLVMGENTMVANIKLADILTLINELESENAYKQEHIELWFKKNEEKKDRIAELEKEIEENAFYSKGYAQGIKNTYEVVVPDKLKQFATLLKVKTVLTPSGWCVNIEDIDETLKEFIKE